MLYGNNVLMDRFTQDFFENYNHTNRIMRLYDENPATLGDLTTFQVSPILTYQLTEDVVRVISGLKFIEFKGKFISTLSTPKLKTAFRWFTISNFDQQFLFGGRVGNFLHGLPMRTERLIVEPDSDHELFTFQLRIELEGEEGVPYTDLGASQ